MIKKVLTISIAAYNVAQFIENTLDSLLVSEKLLNKLEVYVIDDGGADETLKIAMDYERRYPNIIYAIHKEDEGYGSTFNCCIERATGKYFKLLDGDDWFLKENLVKIIPLLEELDSDIIVNDFYKCKSESDYELIHAHSRSQGEELDISRFVSDIQIGMWALIYRTDLLKRSGLKLPENMFYVDQVYSTFPFANAHTVKFLNLPLYCYRVGRDGQSVSRESRVKYADQMIKCSKILLDFCEGKRSEQNENYKYILNRVSIYYQTAFRTLLLKEINKKNRDEIVEFENDAKLRCFDVYNECLKIGKAGLFINLFRKSKYYMYWAFKIHRLPNWK